MEDIPVLPPMHGDVPSTTRPEINITDLERRGMRVGAHSASCAAEAASTQAASDKGSEDDGGAGGQSGSGGARATAPSMPGSSSVLGHSSGGAGARDAMRPPTGSAPGAPGDGAARRILEELGRMHALLHAAGASGEIPNDISSLFGSLQQHMEDVAGSMRGHKTLASQLEAPAGAPSTATQAAMQSEASQQQQGTPGVAFCCPSVPALVCGWLLCSCAVPMQSACAQRSLWEQCDCVRTDQQDSTAVSCATPSPDWSQVDGGTPKQSCLCCFA